MVPLGEITLEVGGVTSVEGEPGTKLLANDASSGKKVFFFFCITWVAPHVGKKINSRLLDAHLRAVLIDSYSCIIRIQNAGWNSGGAVVVWIQAPSPLRSTSSENLSFFQHVNSRIL